MTIINQVRLGIADYSVIAVYFLVLLGFGFLFKNMNKTTKDYFAGSGSMLWWLVGATAFMNMFSAWTFTGASGQAYNTGFQVAILFLGNAVGYIINSQFVGGKIRQSGVTTPVEIIRRRYGKVNEQVFTWTRFPISLIQAGTWLSALGVFMASAFGWEPAVAVIICGIIVTIMTLLGGSWAVIASDYLQMLVVMTLSIATAVVILIKTGGIENIIGQFYEARPTQSFITSDYNFISLFFLWGFFTVIRSIFSVNNMFDSYRYLCASDTRNAQKGARLSCALMFVGALIWFVPSWAAAPLFPIDTLKEMFPNLRNVGEATYLVMVNQFMPAGMTGLLLAGVFAATMSSMDSALNTNAGIFIRNFYLPVVNKKATDQQLFALSKVVVVIFGILVVCVGLFINTLRHLTLFDIVLRISSLIMFPAWIPLVLGFFVKKVPDWAAWATLLVGMCVSFFCGAWLTAIIDAIGATDMLTALERKDLVTTFATASHLCITMPFYLCTRFFYKETGSERDKERDSLFNDFANPVVVEKTEELVEKYRFQRQVLGMVSTAAGAVVGLLGLVSFIPAMKSPSPTGSVVLLLSGICLVAVGWKLKRSSVKKELH